MTDIALDKRAKFAAQLRNAANEMRAEDHNGWPVLCDIVADYLDASPSQVAPANPAQTEKLGRFGHHPDPATDFETEVHDIECEIYHHRVAFLNGTPPLADLIARIERAMEFRVGGVETAVAAKQHLRELEKEAAALLPANPEQVTDAMVEALNRFERAAMAYERLGKMTRDDEKTRAIRKDAIAELAQSRAALAAAIGTGGQAVAVKPLEWTVSNGDWYAGGYRVHVDLDGSPALYIVSGWHGAGTNPYGTLDEAQAAAQANHDAYIRSCLALSQPHPADERKPIICDVLTMLHSSGFPDYFTRIRCGDRFLTTYMSKIKGRCEYHAAEFDWLFNGADKPDILAFDYTEPEGLADYLKSIRPADERVVEAVELAEEAEKTAVFWGAEANKAMLQGDHDEAKRCLARAKRHSILAVRLRAKEGRNNG